MNNPAVPPNQSADHFEAQENLNNPHDIHTLFQLWEQLPGKANDPQAKTCWREAAQQAMTDMDPDQRHWFVEHFDDLTSDPFYQAADELAGSLDESLISPTIVGRIHRAAALYVAYQRKLLQ